MTGFHRQCPFVLLVRASKGRWVRETDREARQSEKRRVQTFERPKSAILMSSKFSPQRMFSGLMSRWTIPRSCK
jgi:hypothetical protein